MDYTFCEEGSASLLTGVSDWFGVRCAQRRDIRPVEHRGVPHQVVIRRLGDGTAGQDTAQERGDLGEE